MPALQAVEPTDTRPATIAMGILDEVLACAIVLNPPLNPV